MRRVLVNMAVVGGMAVLGAVPLAGVANAAPAASADATRATGENVGIPTRAECVSLRAEYSRYYRTVSPCYQHANGTWYFFYSNLRVE